MSLVFVHVKTALIQRNFEEVEEQGRVQRVIYAHMKATCV